MLLFLISCVKIRVERVVIEMGRQRNYELGLYNEFEKLNKKLDKANNTISRLSLTNSVQAEELKELNKKIEEKDKKIASLILEIERLKNNNNKDSSNSSKPSSTNGYKKVIINNRKKSSNKKGGQYGHKGETLSKEKIDKMIEKGEIDEVITIEENKTKLTANNKPIITYEYDIQIKKVVIKHVYYPETPRNIITSPVLYGDNIKSISTLMYIKGSSFDTIRTLLSEFTDNKVNPSKGTIYNWINSLSNVISLEKIGEIKSSLLNSLVLHVDETPIKIDGEQYYIHNISNNLYTLQYVNKKRGKDAVKEFGFLEKYQGILVHDHFSMYYNYGCDNAECNVHTLRYLKGVTEFTNHKWAKKLTDLLLEMKLRKEALIEEKINEISDEEYEKYKERYLEIIREGKVEYKKDVKTNAYKDDERKLLNRLEKYVNNHLLFMKKFFVPFSNNRAEADLRFIKIKQKIGKFRSVEGANNFTVIRSYTSTCTKKEVSLNSSLKNIFSKKLVTQK